jgi:hypothetical protein
LLFRVAPPLLLFRHRFQIFSDDGIPFQDPRLPRILPVRPACTDKIAFRTLCSANTCTRAFYNTFAPLAQLLDSEPVSSAPQSCLLANLPEDAPLSERDPRAIPGAGPLTSPGTLTSVVAPWILLVPSFVFAPLQGTCITNRGCAPFRAQHRHILLASTHRAPLQRLSV